MTLALRNDFNQLTKAHGYADLSDEQWSILVENESDQSLAKLGSLVQRAFNKPEDLEEVKLWHKAARLTDRLRAHGFPALTKREAKGVFEHAGQERVSNTALAVCNGEQPAIAQMRRWISEVQAARNASTSQSQAPATASSAPARQAAPSSASRFEAVPPPPGTRTAPVQRTAAARNDNVRNLPPPAARQEAPRQAPPARQEASRQDDRYDEEPTGRQYAPDNAHTGSNYQTRTNAGAGAGNQAEREYDQHSCYGKDVAVTFERTATPDRSSKTVNFKVARAKHQGKTCKEGVDWGNAIILMLEPHEVQIVYAVLMGYGPKCRFAGHGHDNQKWFEVAETEGEWAGNIRITAGYGRDDQRRVNIGHTDLKEVMEVFSRTLQDQAKGQSPVFIMAEVRRVYDLYAKRTHAQENRQGGGGGQRRQANG